jgi:murein DD-endopeptidase MepM/ murein hydrolase activator NlpD
MNTPDPQPRPDRPRTTGAGVWLRVKLLLTGALLGASTLLFFVLMQWHAPGRLGWSMPWLPSKQAEPVTVAALPAVVVMAAPKTALVEIPATLVPAAKPMAVPTPAAAAPVPAALPAAQPGALLIPVAGIVAGQLTDTFSDARGSSRVHDAIDIMAPKGTPVFAVADGRLVKLFNSKQGGLTIYQFDAGETTAYYYAHLERYAEGMTEGRVLRRGETIGYVGSTGNASPDGPHLHFAVFTLGPEKKWWQGTAVNPYPLLTGTP